MNRLFIDPASIDTGWALFKDKKLKCHGSIQVDKEREIFDRLGCLYGLYRDLLDCQFGIDEVHIEQLLRNTHIFTHWSVGVIGAACWRPSLAVCADIPVKSWETYCAWNNKEAKAKIGRKGYDRRRIMKLVKCNRKLSVYKSKVESIDELAAVGMGLWYVNTKI